MGASGCGTRTHSERSEGLFFFFSSPFAQCNVVRDRCCRPARERASERARGAAHFITRLMRRRRRRRKSCTLFFPGERRMAMEEEDEAKRGSPRHATLTFTWRRGAKLTSSSSKNSPARANLIEVNCTGIGYKIGPRLRELAPPGRSQEA